MYSHCSVSIGAQGKKKKPPKTKQIKAKALICTQVQEEITAAITTRLFGHT